MSEPETSRPEGDRKRAAWNDETDAVLREWHDRAAAARSAHYLLATRMRKRNIGIGVPSVVFSAVVGTSLFATLSEADVPKSLRVAIGLVSLAAAVLAALQTFFGFSQRAERHVIAADWYSAVRRQLEEIIALPSEERDPPKDCLDSVRKEMSKIGQQPPRSDRPCGRRWRASTGWSKRRRVAERPAPDRGR